MNAFSEIKEMTAAAVKETANKTKAFENAKETREVRHIKTINEELSGKIHPETDVGYHRHTFRLNGEKVEGVFPEFKGKFDTYLPKDLKMASDTEQFKYCTEKLKQRIEQSPEFARNFTSRQIEQIKAGEPRISGLTWHHNEIPGKMQLVDASAHQQCRHTGGRSIWGGGAENR